MAKLIVNKPVFDFGREKISIYGQAGIGKTSLVCEWPGVLLVAAEKGYMKKNVTVAPVEKWEDFKALAGELLARDVSLKEFRMVAIDTIDALYYMYLEWFLTSNNAKHEGTVGGGYGVGYAMLARGFIFEMNKIIRSDRGVIMIAHAKMEEENGIQVAQPNFPHDKGHQIKDVLSSFPDYTWYMRKESREGADGKMLDTRVIRTEPSPTWVAKSRCPLPDPIVLIEGDEKSSAQKILAAYMASDKTKKTEVTK